MNIVEREPGDIGHLERLIRRERGARQRNRFRIALLAIKGLEKEEIARRVGVAKSTVEAWAYAYRDSGIEALYAGTPTGAPPKLSPEQEEELRQRLLQGPRPEDGVCTLRGADIQRIIEAEFGQRYSLNGVYNLLHRLGFSSLSPRPRHEKNDPAAMEQFKRDAPPFSSKCAASTRARTSASS